MIYVSMTSEMLNRADDDEAFASFSMCEVILACTVDLITISCM